MQKRIALIMSAIIASLVIGFQAITVSAATFNMVSRTLISASPGGDPSSAGGYDVTMTPDARYVLFRSGGQNLIPNPGSAGQVYIYDRQSQTMEIASKSAGGAPANQSAGTYTPISVSNDGRYVLFTSFATNLTDTTLPDVRERVFLRDRTNNTTTLISQPGLASAFSNAHGISADGNIIVYSEGDSLDTDRNTSKFMYNRTTGVTTSLPNGDDVSVSSDGQYVGYLGQASDQSTPGRSRSAYRYTIASAQTSEITGPLGDNASGPRFDNANLGFAYYDSYPNEVSHVNSLYYTTTTNPQNRTLLASNVSGVNLGASLSFDGSGRFLSFYSTGESDGQAGVADTATGETSIVSQDVLFKTVSMQLSSDAKQLAAVGIGTNSYRQAYLEQLDIQGLLSAPILSAASPAFTPMLSWNAVAGADHYLVYRDNVQVASITGTAYTDTTATEGNHSYMVKTVSGSLESPASNTVTVLVDKTPPAVSSPTMSSRLIFFNGNVQISATASDSGSGVAGGEYYIDTDPGIGHGISLTYANGNLSGTAAINNLSPGLHRLYIRAKDNAGNWSSTVNTMFIFI